MEEECEHELFCFSEEWINEDEVSVELKCSMCNEIFSGVIKRK